MPPLMGAGGGNPSEIVDSARGAGWTSRPGLAPMSILMPILIGLVAVTLISLIPEPHRRRLNAAVVAGAGAAGG